MTVPLLLIAAVAGQFPAESGSGRAESGSGFSPTLLNPGEPESGSMVEGYETTLDLEFGGQFRRAPDAAESGSERLSWEVESRRDYLDQLSTLWEEYEAYIAGEAESGSGRIESGSGLLGSPDPTAARRRQTAAELAGLRARLEAEIGRVEGELRRTERAVERVPRNGHWKTIPPPVPLPADVADADPDRVRTLLVGFGWLAALAVGLIGGAFLAGMNTRRNLLGPLGVRRLDLAGQIAETADSLLAAADDGEAGRMAACQDRLRERIGRAAVFLAPEVAAAIRSLVAASDAGERSAEYQRLIAELRAGVP